MSKTQRNATKWKRGPKHDHIELRSKDRTQQNLSACLGDSQHALGALRITTHISTRIHPYTYEHAYAHVPMHTNIPNGIKVRVHRYEVTLSKAPMDICIMYI